MTTLHGILISGLDGGSELREICSGERKFTHRFESDYHFVRIASSFGFSDTEIQECINCNKCGCISELPYFNQMSIIRRIIKQMDTSNTEVIKNIDRGASSPRTLKDSSGDYLASLGDRKPGISTGILELDTIISGLKPGKLYVFAARPGQGKTSLITQILTACAEQDTPCLYYPTEVGAEPIWDKILSNKTNIGLLKFQNGTFSDSDQVKIVECLKVIEKLPLSIVEDFAVTPDKVEQGINDYLPEREGTFRGVCAVDFLQSCAWKDPNSVAEKSQAVYRFKKMAIDYKIPFILASQLNRGDGSADLKNLKGTGTIEELGDVISFIYKSQKSGYPIPTTLDVMKSKYSATGQVQLLFDKNHCRFEADSTESVPS